MAEFFESFLFCLLFSFRKEKSKTAWEGGETHAVFVYQTMIYENNVLPRIASRQWIQALPVGQ